MRFLKLDFWRVKLELFFRNRLRQSPVFPKNILKSAVSASSFHQRTQCRAELTIFKHGEWNSITASAGKILWWAGHHPVIRCRTWMSSSTRKRRRSIIARRTDGAGSFRQRRNRRRNVSRITASTTPGTRELASLPSKERYVVSTRRRNQTLINCQWCRVWDFTDAFT